MSSIESSEIGVDAFDSGEFKFMTNLNADNQVGSEGNQSILHNLKVLYGEEEVFIGNAYNYETRTASGLSRMIGVYVTKQAYENYKASLAKE